MTSLLQEGLALAGFGMGMVFIFLTLLVVATNFMSWVIQQYFAPEPVPLDVPAGTDPRELAAAAAAVRKYRQERQNN